MKIRNTLKNTFAAFALIGALVSSSAHAGTQLETVTISGSFWVGPGEMASVELGSIRHVTKIFVQAEARGHDTTVNVLVNGVVKGTLYLPARDPSYVVTIGEAVHSIEFQNVGSARAIIQAVKAVQTTASASRTGRTHSHGNSFLSRAALNRSAEIAAEAIEIVDALQDYSNLNEYGTYLLPIKKTAARLYVMAMARGDLSSKVFTKLVALRDQIDFAAAYIDQGFERSASFELALSLLGLREEIDAVID